MPASERPGGHMARARGPKAAGAPRRWVALVVVLLGALSLASCIADAPPKMGVAVAGDRSATVTWEAPIGDTGATVVGYRLTPYLGTEAQPAVTFWSAATTQVVTGLTNGEEYRFGVTALQPDGRESGGSRLSNVVVPGSPVAIGAGADHSCALTASGVRCWGSNQLGQLGDGTGVDSVEPRSAIGLADATAITSGSYHTCALISSGRARCWGQNHLGQLGYGSVSTRRATPVLVSGLTGAVSISASVSEADANGARRDDHTCAALASGAVQCWGGNYHGELGNGSMIPSPSPVTVVGVTGAVAVAAGGVDSCALESDGGVVCWGDNQLGQMGTDEAVCTAPPETDPCVSLAPVPVAGISDAVAIAAGTRDTCAVLADGEVRCWGGSAVTWGSTWPDPPATVGSQVPVPIFGVSGAVRVAVGLEHACAVSAAGTVTCWGAGVLGAQPTWVPTGPTEIDQLGGVTAVSVGWAHACAAAHGEVECWGGNDAGQLGTGSKSSTTPAGASVPGVAGTVALTAGSRANGDGHACAVVDSGTIQCWGGNWVGELGRGTLTDSEGPGPVVGVGDATAVATGSDHACAVVGGGEVRCWGGNSRGQLGDGSTASSPLPVSVVGLSGATTVAAGSGLSCALLVGGTVECWGAGGRLGNGSALDATTPVVVSGVSSATAITAGGGHACALVAGGEIVCWGYNDDGELGDGTTTSSPVPVEVVGISGASAVAAGGLHTCAIVSGGAVRCWGWNHYGELGDGTVSTSPTPVPVAGVTGAVAIGAGGWHACAVLDDGTARCWGRNDRGALGNGGYLDSATPVLVQGGSSLATVVAGDAHTCAARTDGQIECWGDNRSGETGHPLTWGSTTPEPVVGL